MELNALAVVAQLLRQRRDVRALGLDEDGVAALQPLSHERRHRFDEVVR